MEYNNEEIARAKELFAEAMRQGMPRRMAVAAMARASEPERIVHVAHKRTYRDYLVQARRDLAGE